MAQMALNFSENIKQSSLFFTKVDDETSAIVANTGNKIVALKIDLIPVSYNYVRLRCFNTWK